MLPRLLDEMAQIAEKIAQELKELPDDETRRRVLETAAFISGVDDYEFSDSPGKTK